MNARSSTSLKPKALCLWCILLVGLTTTAGAAGGAATNAPARQPEAVKTLEVAKSAFVMPRNKNEGRDPFHPNSDYPHQQGVSKPGGGKAPLPTADLKLTGLGGTPDRPIANINNRACGEGEDVEMTVNGGKIQFHVVKILEDSVILTVNGEERVLRFRGPIIK